MADYAFDFQGHGTFVPDGRVELPVSTQEHNKAVEARELEWLRTGPERVFLYVGSNDYSRPVLKTWLGTRVSTHEEFGDRCNGGLFGGSWTYKRSVSCRLFGVLYHGWYMESSGDYCRLKRAKVQVSTLKGAA